MLTNSGRKEAGNELETRGQRRGSVKSQQAMGYDEEEGEVR
jgi:hypothetical protein